MNIEDFFPIVADNAFRARYKEYLSAVDMKLNFDSDADSVQFPVVATAQTPNSLLKPSVYMCFHHLFLFSTTFLNLF